MEKNIGLIPEALIDLALAEDLMSSGDITTDSLAEIDRSCLGIITAKESLIYVGTDLARHIFQRLDPDATVVKSVEQGSWYDPGTDLCVVSASVRGILTGERTVLNFLQRLCGIATYTRRFVDAVKGTGVRILDTRKTSPGMRMLEKYAVRMGGGVNHRFGLSDGILVKDNHITMAGSIAEAVKQVRTGKWHIKSIEVEVRNLNELDEAIGIGVDIVMLDNMDVEDMRTAIERAKGKAYVEISGGVTLDNVVEIASLKPDAISVGALTHSAPAVDISLDIDLQQ